MIDVHAVDHVYVLGATATIRRVQIDHSLFRDYSFNIDRLIKTLGDAADEELWKQILAPLKRYRFSLAATPLQFNNESLSIGPALSSARARLSSYERVHPLAAKQLATLLDLGAILQTCPDNPIRDYILSEFPNGANNAAILLKESRFITPTQLSLRQHSTTRTWAIVTAGQLKNDTCYSHLLVLGAARWFPDYVFNAPRAADVCIVRYAWIGDAMPKAAVFVRGWQGATSNKSDADPDKPNDPELLDAGTVLPGIDWAAIQQCGPSFAESSFDDVPAKIAALDGDFAVFLEDEESATILTLDLDTDEPSERVRRTPVQRVVPGMFVLLRTTGGGDYIVPVADKILGRTATYVRNCQREWKSELRQKVAESSLFEVSLNLLDAGSTCANEINVRNWTSSRNIKTHDPKDFAAILQVIGLEHRTQEYWNAMVTIGQAHQRAGQQIRRALLRRLQQVDLRMLERDGRLEISLPDPATGTLTAFRVIDVAPADRLVATTKLNHPFPLGDPDASNAPR